MTTILYLDTETRKLSTEVEGGFDNIPEFGLSLMVTYDTESRSYKTWMEHNIKNLAPLLKSSDLVVGFNLLNFDYILLQQFFEFDLQKLPSFDILKVFTDQLGFRVSLDNLAKRTLGIQKKVTAEMAVTFWKEAQVGNLESYCQHDINITKMLFEHACKNKTLSFWHPEYCSLCQVGTEHWAFLARDIVNKNIGIGDGTY